MLALPDTICKHIGVTYAVRGEQRTTSVLRARSGYPWSRMLSASWRWLPGMRRNYSVGSNEGECPSQNIVCFHIVIICKHHARSAEWLSKIGQYKDSEKMLTYNDCGAIVYRLGHQVFILRSGVRFPVALPVYGALVQLVRILACHASGHRFEPGTHRQVL